MTCGAPLLASASRHARNYAEGKSFADVIVDLPMIAAVCLGMLFVISVVFEVLSFLMSRSEHGQPGAWMSRVGVARSALGGVLVLWYFFTHGPRPQDLDLAERLLMNLRLLGGICGLALLPTLVPELAIPRLAGLLSPKAIWRLRLVVGEWPVFPFGCHDPFPSGRKAILEAMLASLRRGQDDREIRDWLGERQVGGAPAFEVRLALDALLRGDDEDQRPGDSLALQLRLALDALLRGDDERAAHFLDQPQGASWSRDTLQAWIQRLDGAYYRRRAEEMLYLRAAACGRWHWILDRAGTKGGISNCPRAAWILVGCALWVCADEAWLRPSPLTLVGYALVSGYPLPALLLVARCVWDRRRLMERAKAEIPPLPGGRSGVDIGLQILWEADISSSHKRSILRQIGAVFLQREAELVGALASLRTLSAGTAPASSLATSDHLDLAFAFRVAATLRVLMEREPQIYEGWYDLITSPILRRLIHEALTQGEGTPLRMRGGPLASLRWPDKILNAPRRRQA